ncbi:HAD family phosphatase [Candidatus Roizmanbacteria bacterium]|nr:HAD family phosphatase [Candidatus Roizmanbacteria bacterium]
MLQAVIFDMNGVIIDDERFQKQAWRRYLEAHNIKISEDEFKYYINGRTEKDGLKYIYKDTLSPEEQEKILDERIGYVIEIVSERLQLTEGLAELLNELYDNNIATAIATGSRQRYFNFIMDGLQIRKYFNTFVTANDINKGKPDPEIYLKSAEKLKVMPTECLVFEDAISGIQAAKKAGMKVIGVATTHQKEELAIADYTISTFQEINLEKLRRIVNTVKLTSLQDIQA